MSSKHHLNNIKTTSKQMFSLILLFNLRLPFLRKLYSNHIEAIKKYKYSFNSNTPLKKIRLSSFRLSSFNTMKFCIIFNSKKNSQIS